MEVRCLPDLFEGTSGYIHKRGLQGDGGGAMVHTQDSNPESILISFRCQSNRKASLPGTNTTPHTPHPVIHTCPSQAFHIACHLPNFLYDTFQLASDTSPLHNVPRIPCHLFTYFFSNFILGYLLLRYVNSIFRGQQDLSCLFLPSLSISNNVVSLKRTHSLPLVA